MIEEEQKKEGSFGKIIADGIQSISNKNIELALKNRDVQFQEAIESTKKEADKIAREAVKDQIETAKKDMFIIFGIFASFITFVAGEISILKTIDNIYDKVGFSFLFVSFVQGFLFGVMFLLDSEVIKDKYKKMGWVFSLFFFMGLAFMVIPSLIKAS